MTKKVIIVSLLLINALFFLLLTIYFIGLAPSLLRALTDVNAALDSNLVTPATISYKGFIAVLLYPLLKALYASLAIKQFLLNRQWQPVATIYNVTTMSESIIFITLLWVSKFLVSDSLLLLISTIIFLLLVANTLVFITILIPLKEKFDTQWLALLAPHAIYSFLMTIIVLIFVSLLNQIAHLIGLDLKVSMALLMGQLFFFILSALFFSKSIKYSIMFSWIAFMIALFTMITLIEPFQKMATFIAFLALSLESKNINFIIIDHFSHQIGSITLAITLLYGVSFVAYFFIILQTVLRAKKMVV